MVLILACCLFAQMLAASGTITVSHTPDPITEGNNLTLICNVTSFNLDALEWRKDGALVSSCLQTCNQGQESAYDVTIDTPNTVSYVYIETTLTTRDNGLWSCSHSNQNDSILLVVREQMRLQATSLTPLENRPTTLTCYMRPFTEALYWWKDGLLISICYSNGGCSGFGSYIIEGSTQLGRSVITINQTSQEGDRGVWSCRRGGTLSSGDSASVTLYVRAPVKNVKINNAEADSIADGLVSNITCELGFTYPVATITWYKEDGDRNTSLRSTSGNSSTLSYTGDKADQGRQLYCTAYNRIGETKSDSVVLDIKYPPLVHITPSENPYSIIRGDSLTLTCQVNASNPGVASDRYEWFFNGQRLNSAIYKYRSLTISPETNGSYTCRADNGVSHGARSSSPLYVDVLYAPVIDLPDTYKVIESRNFLLTCSADANPSQITYRWTNTVGVTIASDILSMPSITRRDAGTYTCTATNIMIPTNSQSIQGRNSTATTIEVLYPPMVTTPSSYRVIEDDLAVVVCSAQANPANITYSWSGPPTYQFTSTNSTLTINKIKRRWSGVYTCTARNTMYPTDRGSVLGTNSSETTIDVLYGPKVTILGPDFHTVQENGSLEVICNVSSNPRPSRIYWISRSIVVSNTNALILRGITTNMSGSYYCHAETYLLSSSGRSERKFDQDNIALFVKENIIPHDQKDGEMNSGTVIGLAVLFSFALVGLGVVGVIFLRKYRQRPSAEEADDAADNCPRDGRNAYAELGTRSMEPQYENQGCADTKVDSGDYVNYPAKHDTGDYVNAKIKPQIKPKPKLNTESPYVNSKR